MNKQTFPIRYLLPSKIPTELPSHKSPASGWPYKFRSRRTTGSSVVDQDFCHLSWKTSPYVWTFWLWNFEKSGSILHGWHGYKLILRRLPVHCNLAIWRWYPWSWRPSFEMLTNPARWKKHKSHRIVFHNVASGYNPSSVFFLEFRFQLRVSKQISNGVAKWNCPRLFDDTFFFAPDFCHLQCWQFFELFHSLSTAIAWRMGINLRTRL